MTGQQPTVTARARHLAALELASRSAATFRRTARRYSLCADDAEDAYQRALEILLNKAPTDDLRQLRPWLQTVVKHEALAVRAQRERMLGCEPESVGPDLAPGPEDRAPERERARQTAEALGQLKRSELQCMLLKALGYSYDEIAGCTGYSWTKVNRSLTEGRKRFFERYEQISSGASCERLAPALASAAAEGAVPAEGEELLAHVRGCASCRASLRRRRSATGVELLSPALLLPALRGNWWSRLHDSVAGAAIDRAALAAAKFQQLFEAVSTHKTAAVVASTAALAGGVAAGEQAEVHHARHPRPEAVHRQHSRAPVLVPDTDRERPAPTESPPPAPTAEREPDAAERAPAVAPAEFEPAPAAPDPPRTDAPDPPRSTTSTEFSP